MSESTPDYMSLSAAMEAREATEGGVRAADQLRQMAQEGKVDRNVDPDAPRSFISPTHPNTKFLVRAGAVEHSAYQQAVLGLRPAITREGDLWVKFTSSVCSTRDPEQIAFLEAHSGDPEAHREYHEGKGENTRNCSVPIGLCREQGPGVDDWYKMKLSQLPLASRPVGLDPDVDVDALMRGEHRAQRKNRPASERISSVVEANENAVADRAEGNRN